MYPYGPRRRRFPLLAVIAIVFLAAMASILIFLLLSGGFGSSGGHPFFGAWGGLLLVFVLLWIGFFAVRIAFWSTRLRGRGGAGPYGHPDPAVMVARRRYARGEITREQYDQIMTDLERRRLPP